MPFHRCCESCRRSSASFLREFWATAPLLLLSPRGYLEVGKAAPVTESSPAESAGPASFAAVVRRVKPAVMPIRVRVKTESPSLSSDEDQQTLPKGSPFQRFFEDFGIPNLPNRRGLQQFALAQGSGFFISPDGYAVTNDHVVNNTQSVEVTTDDGKIYPARVAAHKNTFLMKVKSHDTIHFVAIPTAAG
jgi:serine protease Do